MSELNIYIGQLIARQFVGELSQTEVSELEAWKNASRENLDLWEKLKNSENQATSLKKMYAYDAEPGLVKIKNAIQEYNPERKINWFRWAAAASFFLLGSGLCFYFNKSHWQNETAQRKQNILPGGNKATLTLSNGLIIVLDSARTGLLAKQNGSRIIKSNSGRLEYDLQDKKSTAVSYNTLSTPRGGQYQLQLSDGTNVWLDAASSISYPTAFKGDERRVQITGQAYFEVVYNRKMPFRVVSGNQVTEDLGTEFNINAYADEPDVKTTLLEGKAKVIVEMNSKILVRGDQTKAGSNGSLEMFSNVDIEQAVAWKNGYFLFDKESLESVMRKVSRWYDVDIVYAPGQQMDERYLGSISRFGNVSTVLNLLERAGDVKFKVDGKKILVQKK